LKGVPPAELQQSSILPHGSHDRNRSYDGSSAWEQTLGRICRAAAGEDAQKPIRPAANRNIVADVLSRATVELDGRSTGEFSDPMEEVTIPTSPPRVEADGSRSTHIHLTLTAV
jgi:hypothetical protein